ncbi:MAG TPA: sugar transferase [Pirellulales bacterium]|jgi:lipopolysaccharide/colanic/teichoic acid biosynthesis glycosyltransferase|nr:sugar transferase [Pirellulales bacterium]
MGNEAIGIAESEPVIDRPPNDEVGLDANGSACIVRPRHTVDRALKPRRFDRGPQGAPAISPEWPLVAPAGNRSAAYLFAKRLLDMIGALALLVLLLPILLFTLLIVTIATKGHPIFCQQRLGFCGRPFRMFKFRTMVLNALELQAEVANELDGPIFKNFRDPRVTRVGRILRSTSIDELPQLVNVVLGQMSLVGPRPPLACEVAEYEPWQRQRLAVKPGLTCLWQVSGRSEVSFDQWVEMDLWYLENQSVLTDLNLLLRTPWSVVTRRGAC